MKLAFCIFKYFPYGGAQRYFMKLALTCHQHGHEVHIYTTKWEGKKVKEMPIYLISSTGLTNHSRILSFARNLRKILDEKQYDCVIAANKIPGLDIYYAADICYVESVHQSHGYWYRFTPRYKTYAALEESVFGKHSKTQVLLLSGKQKEAYAKHYHTPESRLHMLPPDLELDRFIHVNRSELRKKIRKEYHVKPDQHVLLMIGSSFKTKGLDRAIRSLVVLPEALKKKTVLWVVGQGRSQPFVKLAKKLDVLEHVIFIGASRQVEAFFSAADILIHPSYKESAGIVLIEALWMGLPILTTEACGFASYIERAKAGVVVPLPFQQSCWNQSLVSMLKSPEKLKIFRKNALSYVKHMNLANSMSYTVNLIEKICEQN